MFLRATSLLALLSVAAPAPAGPGARGHAASDPPRAPSLEEAREEIGLGRFWHAAEILRGLERDEGLESEGLLLLAEARAGFRDWDGVREILEGAAWIDSIAPVRGHDLLGRAFQAKAAWGAAEQAFLSALDRGGPDYAIAVRLARAAYETRGADAAIAALARLPEADRGALSPAAFELALAASAAADTSAVARFLELVDSDGLADRSRSLYPEAVLASGDSARAEGLFRILLESTDPGSDRAGYGELVGSLAVARGDSVGARVLFEAAMDEAPRSRAGMQAAQHLVDLGGLSRERYLAAARAVDRLGDGGRALTAYDRYVAMSREEGVEPEPGARVERARLAGTVRARQAEAIEEFRALDEHPETAVGARVLEVWAQLRLRQGEAERVRTLRRWLVERYPDSDEAAAVVFDRGADALDVEDWSAALGHFREVTEMAPGRNLAGLAHMRIGQIHLQLGDPEAAVDAYRRYLDAFPNGRRWTEASFWAGRTLVQMGDTAAALPFLERVIEDDPLSYYAAGAAEAIGREFPPVLAPPPSIEEPAWVAGGLARLDLLSAAGLERAAAIHVAAIAARADAQGPSAQYPLGEGLIARGWTIEGINRGWALLRGGESWNQRLVRLLYPYPLRAMVEREAEEWGLDPMLVAALIRQESAWDHDIVSSAGAIGLMQVMPATGRQLARAVGPSGFTRESLESAEVNLHLGARFLRDMLGRFGPDLPLVLSAYNAGPTRANRWKNFAQARDPVRFTERIPFTETRGYVKNVTRNVALYRSLYGATSATPITQ